MTNILQPQPGPQMAFAKCSADIAVYGGAAGSGKTRGELYELARWCDRPRFAGILFRRDASRLVGPGSVWEEACPIYESLGARMRAGAQLDAVWPSGAHVAFRGLIQEQTAQEYKGFAFDLVCFDELTEFTERQFWYLWSRVRSGGAGIRGYMRATTNPDPDSWVRHLIDWWIGPDGLPIAARSGVLRWFARRGDERVWFDSEAECQAYLDSVQDKDQRPQSLTFIAATLADNPALELADPGYRARLASLDAVTRAQLLGGNWNARAVGGALFSRVWFDVLDALPTDLAESARGWDFAASAPTPERPDPDWTRSVRMDLMRNGQLVVSDVTGLRDTEGPVEMHVRACVKQDGPRVTQCIWQDPGAAGKAYAERLVRVMREALPTVRVDVLVASKDKLSYAKPFSARIDPRTLLNQTRAFIVRAPWNQAYLSELEAFPTKGVHDDQVDASSRAFGYLDPDSADFSRHFIRHLRRVQA